MQVFYLPKDGVCGDFIPYYNKERGCFEVYYLHDYRGFGGQTEGTIYRRLSTTDGVHFTEEGDMILRGSNQEQDLFCYTGCVVIHEGLQHIFYTGHNYHFMSRGGRKEAVMHAVSKDGKTWEKRLDLTFYAPEGLDIELNDWRDPFVFYNEEEKCWWMLLCTRKKTGPDRMRGATGLLKSQDLDHWTYCEESFWSPSNCWCPECPELFQWGKYWYFIYSTFNESEGLRTYYRISDKVTGPWKAPKNNTFDGRAFYAGKTAFDGEKRYIFGWNPTRTGDTDSGVWQWGGCLVVHELVQLENGELRVKMPDAMPELFGEAKPICCKPLLKEFRQTAEELFLREDSGFAACVSEELPEKCMIEAELLLAPGTRDAGITLHADEAGDEGYYLRLEADHSRLVFDRTHRVCEHIDIERNVPIETGIRHKLTVLLDGTAVTAWLDDAYALSARMYEYQQKRIIPFVSDGAVTFRKLTVRPLKEAEA